MSFDLRMAEILQQTDSELRDLMQQAIDAGDYEALSRITEAAKSIAGLVAEPGAGFDLEVLDNVVSS